VVIELQRKTYKQNNGCVAEQLLCLAGSRREGRTWAMAVFIDFDIRQGRFQLWGAGVRCLRGLVRQLSVKVVLGPIYVCRQHGADNLEPIKGESSGRRMYCSGVSRIELGKTQLWMRRPAEKSCGQGLIGLRPRGSCLMSSRCGRREAWGGDRGASSYRRGT
jgi:hypothetical protein